MSFLYPLIRVALAFVLTYVAGAVWYTAFSGPFVRMAYPKGFPEDAKSDATPFVATAVGWAAVVGLFDVAARALQLAKVGEFVALASFFALFTAAITLNHAFYERRPKGLYLLAQGYHFLGLLLVALVFSAL